MYDNWDIRLWVQPGTSLDPNPVTTVGIGDIETTSATAASMWRQWSLAEHDPATDHGCNRMNGSAAQEKRLISRATMCAGTTPGPQCFTAGPSGCQLIVAEKMSAAAEF